MVWSRYPSVLYLSIETRDNAMPEMTTVERQSDKKRLGVFLDGTTDKSEGNTNVWRARCLCAPKGADGLEQRIFYAAGVGTQLGEIARGDVFGYGIDDQVIDGYGWLIENYEDGDDIFIFGFSRGAFAARSLSGFISRSGLIRPGSPLGVKQLYDRYKKRDAVPTLHDLKAPDADPRKFTLEERWMVRDCAPAEILFTGVWDTVGSVPTTSILSAVTGGDHSYLDVNLRKNEKYVFHAMAIDENRAVFDVTLLSYYHPNSDPRPYECPRTPAEVEQRWFCGAHGDVGGGSYSDALAQLPLRWLLTKASLHGMAFKRSVELDDEARTGPIEDTFADFLDGAYKVISAWQRHWRPIGRAPEPRTVTAVHTINETIDSSVFDRLRRDDSYRPKNLSDWATRQGVDPKSLTTSVSADDHRVVAPD
jgi:uncharacterized protein (DUF2235 family)